MGNVKKQKMSLGEVDLLFRKTTSALEQKSPVKNALIKTLEGLQVILQEESKEFLETLNKIVKEYDKEGKPIFKKGFTEKEYTEAINTNKAKEVEVEIHQVRATENYILPNGQRIRIIDFLEKSVDISPAVFLVLKENYIKN